MIIKMILKRMRQFAKDKKMRKKIKQGFTDPK